jgi:hypothetical protein
MPESDPGLIARAHTCPVPLIAANPGQRGACQESACRSVGREALLTCVVVAGQSSDRGDGANRQSDASTRLVAVGALGADGLRRTAPSTFGNEDQADEWLIQRQAELLRGDWSDPNRGKIPPRGLRS